MKLLWLKFVLRFCGHYARWLIIGALLWRQALNKLVAQRDLALGALSEDGTAFKSAAAGGRRGSLGGRRGSLAPEDSHAILLCAAGTAYGKYDDALMVKARKTESLLLELGELQVLRWRLEVDKMDIVYSVVWTPATGVAQTLREPVSVGDVADVRGCSGGPLLEGSFFASVPGKVEFVLDNSYSKMRGKKVVYHMDVGLAKDVSTTVIGGSAGFSCDDERSLGRRFQARGGGAFKTAQPRPGRSNYACMDIQLIHVVMQEPPRLCV